MGQREPVFRGGRTAAERVLHGHADKYLADVLKADGSPSSIAMPGRPSWQGSTETPPDADGLPMLSDLSGPSSGVTEVIPGQASLHFKVFLAAFAAEQHG